MTSKERLLSAIQCRAVDHVPMTVGFWDRPRHPKAGWKSERERLAFYAARGWDTCVNLWCGVQPGSEVRVAVSHERDAAGPILRQVWHTPAGDVSEKLRVTDEWPEAREATPAKPIWLLHDFRTARYIEFPFKTPADLAVPPHLFPLNVDKAGMASMIRDSRTLAEEFHVPLFVDIRSGLDWLFWLYPAEEAVLRVMDQPEMASGLLDHINAAYRRRLDVYLECGVDGILRSGWLEGADLWSPEIYRRHARPRFAEEIRAVKSAGAVCIYLMDSGAVPLLSDLDSLSFDCLAGVDPATAGGVDLASIRRRLSGKSLWGGISGPLHLGRGTPAEAEAAVERAFAACGKTGFILGPMVGFRHDWPWENLEACDRAWKRMR